METQNIFAFVKIILVYYEIGEIISLVLDVISFCLDYITGTNSVEFPYRVISSVWHTCVAGILSRMVIISENCGFGKNRI